MLLECIVPGIHASGDSELFRAPITIIEFLVESCKFCLLVVLGDVDGADVRINSNSLTTLEILLLPVDVIAKV